MAFFAEKDLMFSFFYTSTPELLVNELGTLAIFIGLHRSDSHQHTPQRLCFIGRIGVAFLIIGLLSF